MRGGRAAAYAALALVAASGAAAQQPLPSAPGSVTAAPPPPVYHGRTGTVAVTVPKVDASARIDGNVTDAAWSEAALLTGFSQYQPVDGVAAADSTEVLVFYTEHAIYFAVRAFAPAG